MLSAEIVGYSKLSMDQQTRLLGRLVRIVAETAEFRDAQTGDQLIGLPTAEGMTLVFFGDPIAPVRCAAEIGRALHSYPEMKLRMGIHSGPVYRMAGIDARTSVAGEGLKTAQRIMSTGDAGHILLSKPVADTLSNLGSWARCLYDLGEHELTPGVRLQLFNLYTGEVGTAEQPGALSATIVSSAALAAEPATAKKMRPFLIVWLSVAAAAVAITGYLTLMHRPAPSRPLLTTEFAESFINLDRWKRPPSGWTFVNESLQVENQPIVGYPPEVNCADFTMTFHLKLINDGGAAWALRVKDTDNYYLFYLSGPGGLSPNIFFSFVVQDGKTIQKAADSVVVHLVPGGEYQISIDAKNNQISHRIRTDVTKPEFQEEDAGYERKLGFFQDVDNTHRAGSIGFLTFGAEKFAVSALYVRPPGVKLPG
ncbi:MAG TPA: adenylate/guanylate cyclase domain-containing protein [Blastocatellia bacterium]